MTDQTTTTTSAAHLDFPPDSVWDRDAWFISRKKTVFVRPCYANLFALCQTTWEKLQGVFLKGTPGVGKSYFLDYAMDRLLKTGGKVLLLSGPKKRAWLCFGFDKQIEECPLDTALTDRWADKADYVLFDPHENPLESQALDQEVFCDKPFLIAMSPDPHSCAKIVKDTEETETFFMGPTTMEESENMRVCCYSTRVTPDQLRRRFYHGGGVPRFLFKTAGVAPRAGTQDAALDSIVERQAFALNDLAQSPRRIDARIVASEFKSLWSLYHLVPDEYNTSCTIELCCDNAISLLRQRLLEKSVEELWYLFDTTDEKQGTLRGIRFEAYAHKKVLVDGINLTAKKLNVNNISQSTEIKIVIPSALTVFELPDNDVGKLKTQAATAAKSGGGYLLPYLPNYPVLDSAFVNQDSSATILQMKAGRSKPLSLNHVSAVHGALGNVFVVVTPAENIVNEKLVGGPDGMQQYVLILRETHKL